MIKITKVCLWELALVFSCSTVEKSDCNALNRPGRMRERIGLVHGEIRWETKPGQGTRVRVNVPVSGPGKLQDGAI